MNSECVLNIVEKHRGKLGGLLSILHEIQLAFGYLSEEALRVVAENTGKSLADIYGFASFYSSFRFKSDFENQNRGSEKNNHECFYVKCPHCNHSLMDLGCYIEGLPTIQITASSGVDHGWLRIPSCADVDSYACEYDLPGDGVVNFFCPHCSAELVAAENCLTCGSPMIPRVGVGYGCLTRICSRVECLSKRRNTAEVPSA